MTLPSWQDKKRGGMVRAALWLETVVGVGNIFTKAQLRQAFPDQAQIDRRVRDLRDRGWQIDTNLTDPSLKQEEQRYVAKGAEVWIPGQGKSIKAKDSLTEAQRTKVLLDDTLCRLCGIGSGEPYGDGSVLQAKLEVARRKVRLADGTVEVQLVLECNRCRRGGDGREVDLGQLLDQVKQLTPVERKVLAGWIESDRRTPSPLERLWGIFRILPAESRTAFTQAVASDDE
ncbi:hypothetical protein AB0F13_06405 [Streptomyces sp. NPDC026206]|uniref:hypothetical protein n=1 Tax=Streptomyces sp. NPDC026206 TaxID=3157089 RepID=UPI0033C2AD0E